MQTLSQALSQRSQCTYFYQSDDGRGNVDTEDNDRRFLRLDRLLEPRRTESRLNRGRRACRVLPVAFDKRPDDINLLLAWPSLWTPGPRPYLIIPCLRFPPITTRPLSSHVHFLSI